MRDVFTYKLSRDDFRPDFLAHVLMGIERQVVKNSWSNSKRRGEKNTHTHECEVKEGGEKVKTHVLTLSAFFFLTRILALCHFAPIAVRKRSSSFSSSVYKFINI